MEECALAKTSVNVQRGGEDLAATNQVTMVTMENHCVNNIWRNCI